MRTLPVSVGMVIGSGLSTKLEPRLGTKRVVAAGLGVLAASLAVLTGADAKSGYALIGLAYGVLGLGMGRAMAPATDSIMGSLPLEQSSIGSAVNDTVRMVGGALGVAVLGSIVSTRYAVGMEAEVAGLPEPAARAAGDDLGAALDLAAQTTNPDLAEAARVAFVGGMSTALWVAAGIAVLGSLVALFALPSRARDAEPGRRAARRPRRRACPASRRPGAFNRVSA